MPRSNHDAQKRAAQLKYSQKIAYYVDLTLIFSSFRKCQEITLRIFERTSANPLVTQATSPFGAQREINHRPDFLPIHETLLKIPVQWCKISNEKTPKCPWWRQRAQTKHSQWRHHGDPWKDNGITGAQQRKALLDMCEGVGTKTAAHATLLRCIRATNATVNPAQKKGTLIWPLRAKQAIWVGCVYH